jgi:hypothetical protein
MMWCAALVIWIPILWVGVITQLGDPAPWAVAVGVVLGLLTLGISAARLATLAFRRSRIREEGGR